MMIQNVFNSIICISLAKEELTIEGISFVTHDLGGHETGEWVWSIYVLH